MSLIKKFASVGGATMASRLLGFVREALIGAALGAGPVADAFYAAFGFPNLFRRLFAEGAFNAAFVPLFAKRIEECGMAEAKAFAEQVLSVLLVTLFVITAIGMMFMPFLVGTVVAPKFADTPDKFELTIALTRIMFPYLMAMSLLAMLSGILNSLRKYFIAALAPVLLNIVLVGVLAVALYLGIDQITIGYWLAYGVMVSGIAQLGLVGFAAKREGMLLALRLPKMTPSVKRLLILMGPAMLTGGVVQINILVGRIIASGQDGAIALLNYADRINQLPLGVIGIAIGVVLLPELSRALGANNEREAAHLQNRSLEFALALTLPAAIFFVFMPEPIVNLLYQRGAFTDETTALTSAALAAFAVGLPAYVLVKVFQPAFFAREDMTTPFRFSVINVALNIGLSLLFFDAYGHVAIAAATAISAWLHVVMLAITLWRRGFYRPSPESLMRLAKIILCGAIMIGLIFGAHMVFAQYYLAEALMTRLFATLGTLSVISLAYLVLAVFTGALNRNELKAMVRRRKPT